MPLAATVTVTGDPALMLELAGWVVTDGAIQTEPATKTMTLASCVPHGGGAVTRTQYPVVAVGETTVLVLVAPAIGLDVSPRPPVYHWIVNGPEPAVEKKSVDDCPALMVDGCAVTPDGPIGEQVTVTVTSRLSAGGAQKPVTRTQ